MQFLQSSQRWGISWQGWCCLGACQPAPPGQGGAPCLYYHHTVASTLASCTVHMLIASRPPWDATKPEASESCYFIDNSQIAPKNTSSTCCLSQRRHYTQSHEISHHSINLDRNLTQLITKVLYRSIQVLVSFIAESHRIRSRPY